MSDHWAFPD